MGENEEKNEPPGPLQIIFLIFMLLITFYLTFLYIKSKEFHNYSCYNIIIMSIVIFISGVINIFVPVDLGEETVQYICGLIKEFFNKIIMTILTIQVIVLYFGIIKTDYYYSQEKRIFIIGLIVSAGVSIALSIVSNSLKVVDDEYYEYLGNYKEGEGNSEKANIRIKAIIIIEMTFCFIIFAINVFCLVVVMNYISKKNKEAKAGLIEDLGYKNQLIRFIFMFILNIISIVACSVFLVFDVFDPKTNQSVYLAICFVIDLVYSINKTVIKETLRIFCGKKDESEDMSELKKRNTFAEEAIGEDDDED